MAQVVDAEGLLEALSSGLSLGPYAAGVVHQHVQSSPRLCDGGRALPDRGEVSQVQRHHMHVVVAGALPHLGGCGVGLLEVPAGENGGGTRGREAYRGLLADAAVGAGDDDDLALHR